MTTPTTAKPEQLSDRTEFTLRVERHQVDHRQEWIGYLDLPDGSIWVEHGSVGEDDLPALIRRLVERYHPLLAVQLGADPVETLRRTL